MKTSSNNNNIESKNGMSQVINILTGETKKMRCHYLSKRTDKPVSRVLTLERLNHPALTAAGVTAWAERFNDGVNNFDWLRVSIQLTDKICYTPNCANVGLPDVENYGNLDYYKNQEGAMRVYMNNVDKFFQSIADKPAKMMTGEDWPNMAVIAAYRAAGRDKEADTLTAARDIYNARREADKEAWSKKYAAQQYYYNSPKPKNFDELTELEKAQFMMQTAQECAKGHPELDWTDILEKTEKRLEKAQKWQEFLDREAEKQNSFAEGMRVTVPACSLTDGEAFVIVTIRRKAADNGGNASLTVKSETRGKEYNVNGSDVRGILPPLEPASEITDPDEDPTLTEAEKRDTLCRLWDAAWQQAKADPETYRVIVETNEEDPSANCNPFGRYYMVDGSENESCIEHAGQWVVIRVDTVTSPYEVHRPNWHHLNGYADSWTQLACRCENPNNVTRWARKMIDAGRVTDIYADCY